MNSFQKKMATKKTNTYIELELDWLQSRAEDLKSYVDANPLATLKDRLSYKTTPNGGQLPMVVASIESQVKSIRDTLKDYAYLCEAIDKLREKEDTKIKARGGQIQSGLNSLEDGK